MLSNQILTIIADLRSAHQSAPLLLSEKHVCEVYETLYNSELTSLDELEGRSITDLLIYDCADKAAGNHKADTLRKQTEKLHEKPAGDLLVAVFRHIDILTDTSANALLRVFEDVPPQVLILVTSTAPQKIIPTLLSRMLIIDG
jgi:DNA polymerase III gamma/tau subunit